MFFKHPADVKDTAFLTHDDDDPSKDDDQWLYLPALRITKPYLNDSLKLMFLANTFGPTGDDGPVQLIGGIVFYHSGDLRRTMGISDNDRVYLDVRYSF